MELRRYSATRWTLTEVATGSWSAAPATAAGTAGAAGSGTYKYVVTAIADNTYEESEASSVMTIASAATPTAAAPNVVNWTAVSGAIEYRVYGDGGTGNGTYGYLGVATGMNSFRDVGTAPDFADTPPTFPTLFDASLQYPAVNVIYQQRRLMAGTDTDRELVHASRVGYYNNFSRRSPLQDDDALTFRVASKEVHPIRHMRELAQGLVMLTDAGEWILQGDETGTLTPTAINPRQHGWVGASYASPVVIGHSILFVQARGNMMRDLRFDERVEGLSGRDLSLFSGHLFKGYTIGELAYAQVPESIVWAVRNDGTLLGLTYNREEDVWGWHRHDTDGLFESVCVIPEDDEDAVYVVVKRTIDGATKRYVERLHTRVFTDVEDAFFVDCGLSYDGAPATVFSGLDHLEGKTVNVLADGAVPTGTFVVDSGSITLPSAASVVHIGLPITAELETLDLDVQGTDIRGRRKIVKALDLLLEASSHGFYTGPDADHLFAESPETWDTAAGLVDGLVATSLTSGFTDHGRVFIRHTAPTPLTILALLPQVEMAG
jgi:hypothetical protein